MTWRNVHLTVLNRLWQWLRVLVTLDFSDLAGRNRQLTESETAWAKLEASRKQYVAESRARFDALAANDPILREMIRSLESTLMNLHAVEPGTRFLALSVLDIYHSEGNFDTLGQRLESLIFSDRDDAIPAACATFRRYCPDYYANDAVRKTQIAGRLAALILEESKPIDLRLAAYRLLCRLCGSYEQAINAMSALSPTDFDLKLIKRNL